MLTREILKWTEKKFDKVMENDDPKDLRKDCLKAAGIGAIEGFIDYVVVVGAIGLIGGFINGITGQNKK